MRLLLDGDSSLCFTVTIVLRRIFLDEDTPVWRPGPCVHAGGDLEVHGAQAGLHQGESRLPQVRQRARRAHWGRKEGVLAGLWNFWGEITLLS